MGTGKKETVYAFLYGIASKVVTYFLLLVFANLYLPQDYGLGTFVYNIRNIVMMFAFIGLPDALVPFIIRKKNSCSILKWLLVSTSILTVLGLIFLIRAPWVWPLILSFPLVMLTAVATAFWRVKAKYDMPIKIGFYSTLVTLAAAFFLKSYGSFGFVAAYSLGNLFSFLALFIPVRREFYNTFKNSPDIACLKQYIKSGAVIALIGSIFVLLTWINSTILGIFGDFTAVARFGVSMTLSGVISIIATSLSMYMVTRSSQITNKKESLDLLHRVTRVSFFSSLCASVAMISLMPIVLKLFFPKYVGTELFIAIATMGMIFFSAYFIIYSYYIGKMKSERALLPILLGLVINTALTLLLASRYGLLGVVSAISLAHFVILLWISSQEKIKRIALVSVVAVPIIYLSYLMGIWGLLLLIAIIPLSVYLRIITRGDLGVIKRTAYDVLHLN